jgi:hypothetical protein
MKRPVPSIPQDRAPGVFGVHRQALPDDGLLKRGKEDEMNTMPHMLPLLSHNHTEPILLKWAGAAARLA